MNVDAQIPAESGPNPPPLPTQRQAPSQRPLFNRIFGIPSRPSSPLDGGGGDRSVLGGVSRYAALGALQDATASHKTGLEIHTLSINESGTHALLGGKEIFKTVKIENGVCVEDLNLRTAIRSTPTQASGRPRQVYTIDIADVAWGKGDCGDYVAAATSSGKIILYDLGHAGLPAAQLHEHYRQVHRITFNPHQGSLLLSGSHDGSVRLWDVRDARKQAGGVRSDGDGRKPRAEGKLQSKSKFSGSSDSVRDVKWSPTDGVEFAFGTDNGYVQVWDMRNMKMPTWKVPGHNSTCTSVDWHPDGKHLASAGVDKLVKIWDLSQDARRPKYTIQAPYALTNARWRPSCESSILDDSIRQCTQLVTAYHRDQPVMHVWDLRRPLLPFREMTPHTQAPTDLLWHSQDLLWTVGHDGVFMQIDIQHSNKVMDNICANKIEMSNTAELMVIATDQRPKRKPKRPSDDEDSKTNVDDSGVSRSWADDGLDGHFLNAANDRRQRSSSAARQISTTPPSGMSRLRVANLDHVFTHSRASPPKQLVYYGRLPHPDLGVHPAAWRFMAMNYIAEARPPVGEEVDVVEHIQRCFEHNKRVAKESGMRAVARDWGVIGSFVVMLLRRREEALKALAKNPAARLLPGAMEPFGDPIGTMATHAHLDTESNSCLPAGMAELLRQYLADYTGRGHHLSAQIASHLLLVLLPCLPDSQELSSEASSAAMSHYADVFAEMGRNESEVADLIPKVYSRLIKSGLQPLRVESILSAYHEQLLVYDLSIEAATLRNLCYPAFPAVYEQGLQDNQMSMACGSCDSPIFPSRSSNPKCENCFEEVLVCPHCDLKDSPYTDSPVGTQMLTLCLLCGHGGHAACMHEVFIEAKLGGCVTEGCLCDCTDGMVRAEKERMEARKMLGDGKGAVEQDPWNVEESKAVGALKK